MATAEGGIWAPENGLDAIPSWRALSDHIPFLATSGISFSPLDVTHNTLYAGLGGFDNGADDGNAYGIIKTIDGGNTWTNLAVNEFANTRVWRVLAAGLTDPISHQEIVLASTLTGGVFRSTNAGISFTLTLADPPTWPISHKMRVTGLSSRCVAHLGVFRSMDAGETWASINGDLSPSMLSAACCMWVAVSPAGSHPIYLANRIPIIRIRYSAVPMAELPGTDWGPFHLLSFANTISRWRLIRQTKTAYIRE